jgi:spore germination protein GerM
MEEQKSVSKSVVTTAISAFAVVTALTGGGIAWWMTQDRPQPNTSSTITSTGTNTTNPAQTSNTNITPIVTTPKVPTQAAPTTTAPVPSIAQNPANVAPATDDKVKVFWIDDKDNKKTSVSSVTQIAKNVPQTQEGFAKASLTILLASAGKEGKQTTTIPAGTKLLSSQIKDDGLHVDLSKEFTEGGGSTSMQGRIAQVLYTATSRNPDMPVWISVEGKQVEALGGEGVEIKQPLTRKAFQQEFKDSIGE